MSFRIMSGPDRVVVSGNIELQPFVRYVLPAGPAQAFKRAMVGLGIEITESVFNSFCRPYGGANLNGKRLAFFRHSAYGDQLMATSVPIYLKHLFPHAMIDVYCAPDVMEIWHGLPVRVFKAPMTLEAVQAYDWHLFYDQMLEENREPDQGNAFDDMFAFAGFREVPEVFKVPKVVPLESDTIEITREAKSRGWPTKYLVYQLGAANQNRTYPYAEGGKFIRAFLDTRPDWSVVVVGIDKTPMQAAQNALVNAGGARTLRGDPRVLNLVNQLKSFRSLIPIVSGAGLVVCPDSSIGHLAAAFPQVPVISLWGLFSPNDRAKYYPNHTAIWPQAVCPHAPCHSHEFKLPQAKCANAANATAGEQKWCNVLRAITPEQILKTATEILNPKKT